MKNITAECDLCRERKTDVVVTECNCCLQHGRSTLLACASCKQWMHNRITCPMHGDCC